MKKVNWSNFFTNAFITLSALFMISILAICIVKSDFSGLKNLNFNFNTDYYTKCFNHNKSMLNYYNDIYARYNTPRVVDTNFNVMTNYNVAPTAFKQKSENPQIITKEAVELAKIKDAKEAKLAEQKQLAKNRKVKVRIKALINDGVTKRTVNVDAIGDTINAETISAMTSTIKRATLNMAAIRNNDLKNDKYYIGRGWLNQYTEKLGFLNK